MQTSVVHNQLLSQWNHLYQRHCDTVWTQKRKRKRQACTYIWSWSSALSVTAWFAEAHWTSFRAYYFCKNCSGKKSWCISWSKIQTRTKANIRQMFCRFKVKNDTLCKSSVITERNFYLCEYHFPFLLTLVLAAAQGPGRRITGLCGEILFSWCFWPLFCWTNRPGSLG